VVAHVPTDVKVTVTSSPTRGIEATLRLSEQLASAGFEVVPHVAARLVRDEEHLRDIFARFRAIGVHDVFTIAGDADTPAGAFGGATGLLEAMAGLREGIDEVGISGYPESHPFISDETTIQVMFDKKPFATYIVSQLCLDAAVIAWWIGAVRARGVHLPIHIGIPAPIQRRKLLRIATRIGVGESTRFVRGHGGLLRTPVPPWPLRAGLADRVPGARARGPGERRRGLPRLHVQRAGGDGALAARDASPPRGLRSPATRRATASPARPRKASVVLRRRTSSGR
jgi:methylenetetrahydrofolate reductase (NADPH)